MKNDPKTQTPVIAKRDARCFTDLLRQCVQLAAENVGHVFAWVCPRADDERVVGTGIRSAFVRRELGKPTGQAANRRRQVTNATAGDVLLIQVVLLEQGEPLRFGVGLGECEHGRLARRDRLDLGVGKFLAADIFCPSGGVVAGHDLRNEPGLGLQGLPHVSNEPIFDARNTALTHASQATVSSWPPSRNTRMPIWPIRITWPNRLACVSQEVCRQKRRTKLAASSGSTARQTMPYLA